MTKLETFFKNCPTPSKVFDKEDSETLIRLTSLKEYKEPLTYAEFLQHPMVLSETKEKIHPAIMALWSRVVLSGDYFKMSIDASIFLSLFIRSFDDSALYFSYVAHCAKKKGIRAITLSFIAGKVFPFGVFGEDQLSAMWDLQKNEGSPMGNLLDDGGEWKNYLFGAGTDDKVVVKFSDEDERPLTLDELAKCGDIREPQNIEGRMFFWLGNAYVSVTMADYQKIEDQ